MEGKWDPDPGKLKKKGDTVVFCLYGDTKNLKKVKASTILEAIELGYDNVEFY